MGGRVLPENAWLSLIRAISSGRVLRDDFPERRNRIGSRISEPAIGAILETKRMALHFRNSLRLSMECFDGSQWTVSCLRLDGTCPKHPPLV